MAEKYCRTAATMEQEIREWKVHVMNGAYFRWRGALACSGSGYRLEAGRHSATI
jgi:hypothetical protein